MPWTRACRIALRWASKEASLLRGLPSGALWASALVHGHGLRTCPFCAAAHEDEVHVLWDCLRWHRARDSWTLSLLTAAAAITPLGPPSHLPACLPEAGLRPARLSEGLDKAVVDAFLYRLYGMYLTVLVERRTTWVHALPACAVAGEARALPLRPSSVSVTSAPAPHEAGWLGPCPGSSPLGEGAGVAARPGRRFWG